MDIRQVWFGKSASSVAFRWLLVPPSILYYIGWSLYLLCYRCGFKKSQSPHRPTVIVGNFTVGGSGKTPVTIAIAHILAIHNFEVVIGCSGYGAPRQQSATIAPPGILSAHAWGDEPALIRDELPDVPIIVGRDRVQAARLCHSEFPTAVFLMDDGLQHLPLSADIRIGIEPTESHNHWVLPAGPYREVRSTRRADLIIPGRFHIERQISHFTDSSGECIDIGALRGSRVNVLAGIARPGELRKDIESLGIAIQRETFLQDHDPMVEGRLLNLIEGDIPTIVTTKDWVKLRSNAREDKANVLIAHLKVTVEPEAEFSSWLNERIKEAKAKAEL